MRRFKKSQKSLIVLLGIIILLFLGVFLWWKSLLSPVDTTNKSTSIFVVEKGTGLRAVGENLEEKGLIKSSLAFYLYSRQQSDLTIQAGDFRLSPSYSLSQIVDIMSKGTLDVWVTIPEGKRASEIAEILKQHLPSYSDDWIALLEVKEGYLFPDTYLIPRDADSNQVISLLTNTFEKRYAQAVLSQTSSLTKQEIITIASMIEREAKFPEDREKIASVIMNRLDIDMALQIDATVQYALGNQSPWWKKSLTINDLKYQSPYNTYLHPGLPPGPISNPGLASLTAAANPDKTPYLYYISDSTGHNHYSRTFEEHRANIDKYL